LLCVNQHTRLHRENQIPPSGCPVESEIQGDVKQDVSLHSLPGRSNSQKRAPLRQPDNPSLSKSRRSPRRLSLFGHLLSQAEWPHVRPNFLDVGKTLRFRSCLSHAGPTERVLAVRRPNGILFFVVHYDVVYRRVFSIFTHVVSPTRKVCNYDAAFAVENFSTTALSTTTCA